MMSRSGRKARPIPRRRLSSETRGLRQAPVYSIVAEKICDQASIHIASIRGNAAIRSFLGSEADIERAAITEPDL